MDGHPACRGASGDAPWTREVWGVISKNKLCFRSFRALLCGIPACRESAPRAPAAPSPIATPHPALPRLRLAQPAPALRFSQVQSRRASRRKAWRAVWPLTGWPPATAPSYFHLYSSSFCTEGLVQHAPCLSKAQPPPTVPLAAFAIMFAQKVCVCSATLSACAASTARPVV